MKKGKKLHLSSSPSTTNIKVRKPFTRASTPKEVVEEQSLPKVFIPQNKKYKGQGIGNLMEKKEEIPVQKNKYKGQGIGKPVEKKEEIHVQKKKDKGKGIKKPDEIDKVIPMQYKEETVKNPIETIHITTPPGSQTFKRLIRQLRDARKEVANLKE